LPLRFTRRETVATDTPAKLATSRIVAGIAPGLGVQIEAAG